MKRILLCVLFVFLSLCFLSCNKVDKIVEPPVNEEETLEKPTPSYEVTARTVDDIYALAPEVQAKEFISALALGDSEVVKIYIGGDIEDFDTVKMDAEIKEVEHLDSYEVALSATVSLNVHESESPAFPIGEYDFILDISSSPYHSVVAFFGSAEKREKIPNGYNPYQRFEDESVQDAFNFVDAAQNVIGLWFDDTTFNPEASPEFICHITQHNLEYDNSGCVDLDELNEYLFERFGIADLNDYPALKKLFYELREVTDGEERFSIWCAHGGTANPEVFDGLTVDGDTYTFTFTLFSDYAYIGECQRNVFVFERLEGNHKMRLVSATSESLSELFPVFEVM